MKLHRLDLTGFGPFRQTQTVDFDAFDADGIFLIAGRTGAGKSSVLDGVCFALYGSVPRYDGPDRRLRSDHCEPGDPTEVRLEFTVGSTRWRVIRAPEYSRPKLRGDGTTVETARAELYEFVDGGWVGRAGKPRDVAEVLDGVLGLNLQQFQQVILLAQNKFSRFLLAKNDERQALLRTLFGTRRYEDYARDLDERRKVAQQLVRDRGVGAEALLAEAERVIEAEGLGGDDDAGEDLARRRAAAVVAVQRADYRAESRAQERAAADAAAEAASREHARIDAIRTAQKARVAGLDRLAGLEAATDGIADDRRRIERAVAAETLRAPLDLATRAAAQAADAAARVARALEAWVEGGDEPDTDLERLDDELTGDLARWETAQDDERRLTAATAELDAQQQRIAAQDDARAELERRGAQVPAELASIDAHLARAQTAAGAREAARALRDDLRERRRAAVDAAALDPRVAAAESEWAGAIDASAAAGAALTALLHRRLAGYAGELAAELVAGEPCAVCGATTHPRPAPPTVDPVTDDTVAAAEQHREQQIASERRAGDDARALRAERDALAARAGGEDAAALAERLAAAERAVADAEEAEREAVRLRDRRAQLAELADAVELEQRSLSAELAASREAAARTSATVEALGRAVAAARGDHASVADRIRAATERRARARALRDARVAQQAADAASTIAATDLAERLAASDFSDAAEAASALLPAADLQRRRDRVADHERDLAVVRAELMALQLELAGTPDEPVDAAAAAAADADADAARTRAITALSVARSTADRLRDLVQRSDAAYADIADLADDAAVVTRLADTLQGRAPNTKRMTLETFVLAAELEEIVAAANLRLAEMSAGRYTLLHTDSLAARGAASGLGIAVMDAHTGQSRPPQSLSGGETFLASLALALGLAEVVTNRAGGIRLDTLFVDEGFGSLDPETLEFAMSALDELRAGGRTVGVISHVEAMKEQLPAQLLVQATPQGPSVIRQT